MRSAPRSALSAGCRAFGMEGFSAFLAEDVVERMLMIGRGAAPNEWMGLLMGHVGADDQGDYVVVRAVIHDHGALARPGFIESTHESEARTRLLGRLLFPDLVSIGWAHGHVKCGAYFSGEDLVTQATWQAPYALGVVVDPWDTKELAVVRGPGGARLAPETSAPSEPQRPEAPAPRAEPTQTTPRRSRLRAACRVAVTGLLVLGVLAAVVAVVLSFADLRRRVRTLELVAHWAPR